MKAVILDGICENPGDLSWDSVAALCELTVYDRTPPEEVLSRAAGADILVVNKVPLPERILSQLPDLKFIAVLATGYNIVDTKYAASRSIPVANIPAYSTDSVAQFTFGFILEHACRIGLHTEAVRGGAWTACPDFCFQKAPVTELSGKTLGIVGYGRIGHRVAEIGRAFGMHTLVATAHPQKYPNAPDAFAPLHEVARRSDFVTFHCPLTAETRQLVNARLLAEMKPSVFLVNTSRGDVLDEQAVADALNEGRIAGLGVDVLSVEPPHADNPLLSARNCFITPHIAWAPQETRQRLLDIFTENVRSFLNGTPQNVVNM